MYSYGRQFIEDDDISAVVHVLKSDFLTTGPVVGEFESELGKVTGASYAVACSNGTTALHLAFLAAGVGPGTAVVVPTLTFLATANSARLCGAEVIFCDVDPSTGLMTRHNLAKSLEFARRKGLTVKAIVPVYLKGLMPDIEDLRSVVADPSTVIIADGAHSIGGRFAEKPNGAPGFADMTTYSFHPVKTICAGEGGAIVTNSEVYERKMRLLRSHHMAPDPETGPWAYEMEELGFNYRLTDIQAALGLTQLRKIDRFRDWRSRLVDYYNAKLSGVSSFIGLPKGCNQNDPAWHLYSLRIAFNELGISRAEVMNQLKRRGVGTQVHYIPVHSQSYYRRLYGEIDLPGAQIYYNQTLSLPLHLGIERADVDVITDHLLEILGLKDD